MKPNDVLAEFDDVTLIHELRNRGTVMIVWTPEDMESFGDPRVLPAQRLMDVARGLQDICIERGWDYIDSCLGHTPADPYECGVCDWLGDRDAAKPAMEILLRLKPGWTFTDVECPECGALAFPWKEAA